MEQLIVILIFGVIATVNYLLKKRGDSDDSIDPIKTAPPNRSARPSAEDEEERMRRFMEALGVPASPPPPRKIERPVRTIQKRVSSSVVRPQKTTVSTPSPALPTAIFSPELPITAPESILEATRSVGEKAKIPDPDLNIRAILRNRDRIRQAILLKEILGTPRGLEPYR